MGIVQKLKAFFTKERLIILGVVLVVYFNALKNGYALDDSIVTEPNNLTTQGIKAIPRILKSFYIGSSADYQFEYRPLVKIAFAIEHELFGVSPKTSHFVNILLYLIGLYMMYELLILLFKGYSPQIPFYAVLLFALMPIHTEVVTSIKNRDIILCFIFCLLGFRSYYYFFESGLKRWTQLILSVLFLYLGFLAKYDALPFIAIVPMVFLIKDTSKFKWLALSAVALFVSMVLFKLTRKSLVDIAETKRIVYYFENPLFMNKGIANKSIALLNTLGFYIMQCIYPVKQVCYYGSDTVPVLKLGGYGYLGIIAVPSLAFALVRSFLKKEIVVFTGLFIFCASISMYLNFVKPVVGIVAERFAFFASMGFSIAIVGLLFSYFKLKKELPKNVIGIGIAILLVFAYTSIQRNKDWKDINTILEADFAKYPNNAYLNYKRGMNLVKEVEKGGQQMRVQQRTALLQEARKSLEKSIEVEPNYANSRNYIAYVLVYLLNDFNAALPHINSSIAYRETTELYFYKGIVMRETKHADSAEFYLKKCIDMDNAFYNAYSLLMYDYNLTKNYQKSIDMFNKALNDGVKTEQIHLGLAKTYEEMGNKEEAIKNYREIVKLNPQNTDAANYLKKLEAGS